MISRYSRKEMSDVWSEQFKFDTWLKIEVASCEKLCEMGMIPKEDFENIKNKAGFDIDEIEKIEAETKHDVIAFLTSVANHVGPSSRFIHLGMTSSDVLDTALAYQMTKACEIIIKDVKNLIEALKEKALKYKMTPTMGRSHGIHAEPTTLGLKFLNFHNEMVRNLKRLEAARESVAVGTISGAVGNLANIDPKVEEHVCISLGLKAAPLATQVVQRDRHAEFMTTLAILGGAIEKISVEIRHCQRTEVGELCEGFTKGQKGSSAMPHKKNPIGSENLTGVARLLRANAQASLENIALWHERDISHSSVERVIMPDSTILANYALNRMTNMIENLVVNEKRMLENIYLTQGLSFSGRVLIELAKAGLTREHAYKIVQKCSMATMEEEGKQLKDELIKDSELIDELGEEKLKGILDESFNLEYYFKNVPVIFSRSL